MVNKQFACIHVANKLYTLVEGEGGGGAYKEGNICLCKNLIAKEERWLTFSKEAYFQEDTVIIYTRNL